jgi:aconitate hydratase
MISVPHRARTIRSFRIDAARTLHPRCSPNDEFTWNGDHMTKRQTTLAEIAPLFSALPEKYRVARERFQRPLTLAEKILSAHLDHWNDGEPHPVRGSSYVFLRPDRVAMQDATAQMALLQFMQANLDTVFVPTTVHCDHLIQARVGARIDLLNALDTNSEVYEFLKTASTKYGVGFWKPGSGIIHQVVLENYAFPGGLLIGTDSHTPNGGGLGMLAIGVGGADATFTMAGEPWGLRWPKLIGVKLTGALNGWAAPKDIILKLAGILTVDGGTGSIVEYFGEGTKSISATGKATITNMGAELGATTSVFPLDDHMLTYLKLTGREDIANLVQANSQFLTADPEVEADPHKYFDQVIEIDLSTLEPHIVGPHTPDLARPLSQFKAEVAANGYPADLRYALIGSCTNSSYEDMSRAADVARQATARGIKAPIGFMVTPGSEQVHQTITRDGQLQDLESIGANVLANACGPCIGQWKREDVKEGEANSIITSFNRNFPRRNDGSPTTLAFIASPEVVTAFALKGSLAFNPLEDTLTAADGTQFKLAPPAQAGLPTRGFSEVDFGYVDAAEAANEGRPAVAIKDDSKRLQVLLPFATWDGKDFDGLPVLLKAAGKCTTDHISPAGPWLAYRGHLDRISENMFLGANNAFSPKPGEGLNVVTSETERLTKTARAYKAAGIGWIVVGDQNYGEGSSREHAAMSPRFLGCRAVIARSFARIHETNLKQQGVLALTFDKSSDYDLIQATDRVSVTGLANLAPGALVTVSVKHQDGTVETLNARHTMNAEQIEWFKSGSALNLVHERRKREQAALAATKPQENSMNDGKPAADQVSTATVSNEGTKPDTTGSNSAAVNEGATDVSNSTAANKDAKPDTTGSNSTAANNGTTPVKTGSDSTAAKQAGGCKLAGVYGNTKCEGHSSKKINKDLPMKKVSIIGAGNVGATVAQYLASEDAADVVLLDINEGAAKGKALDLMQALALTGSSAHVSGTADYADTAGSSVVVICAGSPRKPGMSRDDLLKINAKIVAHAARESLKHSPDAIFVVVSNPLDVMAYLVWAVTKIAPERVIGMAGVLDSARFQAFIADELKVSPVDVRAMVLGGHGDLMVPLPRFSTVDGVPVTELIKADRIAAMSTRTRNGGAEIVELLKTGSAWYAPGAATASMVKAILTGKRKLMPCSVYSGGRYDVYQLPAVYIGLPVYIGANGVEELVRLNLDEGEYAALRASADSIHAQVKVLNAFLESENAPTPPAVPADTTVNTDDAKSATGVPSLASTANTSPEVPDAKAAKILPDTIPAPTAAAKPDVVAPTDQSTPKS